MHLPQGKIALVSDSTTWEVLGQQWFDALSTARKLTHIDLKKRPVASDMLAKTIIEQANDCESMIAIGSGTINDLCKYAAHHLAIPYMVCATAPSMNGYVSPTASMTFGKEKRSVAATAPVALIADMAIISKVPRRLIHAGLGDMMCRSTVQADWLLSHLLLDTPYDASLFNKILPLEAEMLTQSDKLREKDPAMLRMLMEMLIYSGEAMAKAGSSAPASQGEHMIVHMMEMLYGEQLHDQYHGEQVAVATITMSQLQDKLLLKQPIIKSNHKSADRFGQIFGKKLGAKLYQTYQEKLLSEDQIKKMNERIAKDWPGICEAIRSVTVPHHRLDMALRRAHCPIAPKDLRWNKDRYEHAVTHAYLSRERFTFLDIAAMDQGMRYWFS